MAHNHITKRADFVRCYDGGRRYFSPSFIVFACRQASEMVHWRIGLAVTKKVGSAVRRNRVKRVLREFFRLQQAHLPEGIDIVVVPKKSCKPEAIALQSVTQELIPVLTQVASDVSKGRLVCSALAG